jgi:hypothetical protein
MRARLPLKMVVLTCESLLKRGITEIIAVDLMLPASTTQANMIQCEDRAHRSLIYDMKQQGI